MRAISTGNGIRQAVSEGLEARQVPFTAIPLIDLAAFQGQDLAAQQQVATELRQACMQVGFFYIVNHGVSQSIIDEAFAQAERFFALPLPEKMQIHIAHSPHHRGYVPLLEENTDPNAGGDLHEAFDCALDLPPDDPDLQAGQVLYGPNVYPDLPEFRPAIQAYYWAMYDLGCKLFRAFALALDLPTDFFAAKITKPLAQLRLLHYPPQTGELDPQQIGTGAHSDYECFTILAQDQVGGLQVLNTAGDWIAASPIPGSFVVNLGDQMARWTNDLFASTVHRAINQSGRARYSIPYFFGPNYSTSLAVLPSCITPERPAQYAPITAGDYILSRFDETFAYRKR